MNEEKDLSLDELLDIRDDLKSLTTHPGWIRVKEVIEGQIEGRRAAEDSMDVENLLTDGLELVKMKAERRGMGLALLLPETMIESLDLDIDALGEDTDAA